MWESRIQQILANPPEFLSLVTNPESPERYQGRYIMIDEQPFALGRMLGQGDEALVLELIGLRDGKRDKVLKICRHPPSSEKYTTWAVPYRIERNPHSAIPDVEMHLARLAQVPGGLVKVQPYHSPPGTIDWMAQYPAATIYKAMHENGPDAALVVADSLIKEHGPRGVLLHAKGSVLAEMRRFEEAHDVLEQAMQSHTEAGSPVRMQTGVLLAAVLSQIYAQTPVEGGATMSLKLDDGTVLSQTFFFRSNRRSKRRHATRSSYVRAFRSARRRTLLHSGIAHACRRIDRLTGFAAGS